MLPPGEGIIAWRFDTKPYEAAPMTTEQIEALQPKDEEREPPAKKPADARVAKRQALPPELPRREIRHEPLSTTCSCGCALKRIGEESSERLDYTPGEFTVERHIRAERPRGREAEVNLLPPRVRLRHQAAAHEQHHRGAHLDRHEQPAQMSA